MLDLSRVESSAAEAGLLLGMMANERRLVILCRLYERECSVGELADAVGLKMPALSQHLAKLKAAGLVEARRDGQTIHYRIAQPVVRRLISFLHDVYCKPQRRSAVRRRRGAGQ